MMQNTLRNTLRTSLRATLRNMKRLTRTDRTVRARLATLRSVASVAVLAAASAACTSQRMSQVTTESVGIMRTFENGAAIPPEEIREAKAIAVLRETEGAVVIGASGGEGVLVRRLAEAPAAGAAASPTHAGEWSPPLGIEVASGSIGLQIGGQTREIILIFKTTAAIDSMLATGAYAIGRIEGTAGDAQGRTAPDSPEPEVVPYVRTGGLYGGLSINGLTIKASDRINTTAYGTGWTAKKILSGEYPPPPGSGSLWSMLDEMAK